VTEPTTLKSQRHIATGEEHRVLQFRPRASVRSPNLGSPNLSSPNLSSPNLRGIASVHTLHAEATPEPLDLSRYEQPREDADDFRHRMLANIAAFAFTLALTAVGIWLAMSIADLRKTQDCMLMGRRDCVRISTTHF
jgi:hypothetical protein